MTDRITKPITAMKEYGRKPYLVTKDAIPYGEKADYRYMMDTTWHKAQDNEGIVVQSVKKKPYQNSDYEIMEQGYDFPIFVFPRWNFNFAFDFPQTIYRTKPNPYPATIDKKYIEFARGLNWIKCPTTVSFPNTYTIIVRNSYTAKRTIVGGRLNSEDVIFIPTSFKLDIATSNARGVYIEGIENKGSTTWVKLHTSTDMGGNFYLYASDGKTEIVRTIYTESWDTDPVVFTYADLSIYKDGGLWREGQVGDTPPIDTIDYNFYDAGGNKSWAGVKGRWGIGYNKYYFGGVTVYYNYNDSDLYEWDGYYLYGGTYLLYTNGNIIGQLCLWDGGTAYYYDVLNNVVTFNHSS